MAHPKAGGREKGTPNKSTFDFREKLLRYARGKNYNPVYAMIKMAVDKKNDATDDQRFNWHEKIARFFVPPLKPIDAETGSSDEVVRFDSVLSHAYEQAYKDTNGKGPPTNEIAKEKTHAVHSPGSDR